MVAQKTRFRDYPDVVYDDCEIYDSFKTLEAAVTYISNEVGYAVNPIPKDKIYEGHLLLGAGWQIQGPFETNYFIVKRTLH